jgi:hypothetical protein
MLKTLLGLLVVVAAGFIALVGFAVFSDLPAPQHQVELPIEAQ